MVHTVTTECGVSTTIDKHDVHCTYSSSISLSSSSDYTDKWTITYASMRESSLLFEQFVYIKLSTGVDTSLLLSPLIRVSCAYSFQSDVSFKSASSVDNKQMIYTVILPSCNTQSIELCTYYIVIEASNEFINLAENNKNQTSFSATYELSASLGILLQFQQKYSYSLPSYNDIEDADDTTQSDTDDIDDTDPYSIINNKLNKDSDSDNVNTTCIWYQFYGVKASLTDFPIGIIVQPEFIDTEAGFTMNEYTSAPNAEMKSKEVNKLKGDAVSESYDVPSIGYISSEDYMLFNIEFYTTEVSNNPNVKYIIYSQSNISYIQVSVINSGGWFLLLILVFLILIAMCRKHCCLRHNNEGLSYTDFLENVQLTAPLFINVAGNNSSNADDQKSIGVTLEELDKVSVIETYHKTRYTEKYHNNKYKMCCICLYDYKNNEKIRKLNCNHYFHQTCVDVWFTKNIQCPLCKQCVINAQILSKISANSADDTSTLSSGPSISSASTSVSSYTTVSASTSRSNEEKQALIEEEEEERLDEEEEEDESHNNIYSLSDSHCYSKPKRIDHCYSKPKDDMYISRHSNPNIITRHRNKSWSTSYSQTPNNTHNNTNTTTITTTATPATINSNDISISSSEPMDIIPLSPNINLYFDNASFSKKE